MGWKPQQAQQQDKIAVGLNAISVQSAAGAKQSALIRFCRILLLAQTASCLARAMTCTGCFSTEKAKASVSCDCCGQSGDVGLSSTCLNIHTQGLKLCFSFRLGKLALGKNINTIAMIQKARLRIPHGQCGWSGTGASALVRPGPQTLQTWQNRASASGRFASLQGQNAAGHFGMCPDTCI